jgi:hypothetical protein
MVQAAVHETIDASNTRRILQRSRDR